MTFTPMPQEMPPNWPMTTLEKSGGKEVRVWRYKNHEMGFRDHGNAVAWEMFRMTTWAIKVEVDAGGMVLHAHFGRHDGERRAVLVAARPNPQEALAAAAPEVSDEDD